MQLIIGAGTVVEASRDIMPTTGTPGWATDGNPATGIAATDFPAAHYNMQTAEIVQVILDAGLTLDGTNWGQLSAAVQKFVANNATGRLLRVLTFTSSGVYIPSANAQFIRVRAIAGGGAGGGAQSNAAGSYGASCGGCGANGGFFDGWIPVSAFAASGTPITIGAAGVGVNPGAGSSLGSSGGNTIIGTFVTCYGGAAGSLLTSTTNGAWSGQSVGGSVVYTAATMAKVIRATRGANGEGGRIGVSGSTTLAAVPLPPMAPASPFGEGGPNADGNAPAAAAGYGAGGGATSSQSSTGYAGGNGGPGFVSIEEWTSINFT